MCVFILELLLISKSIYIVKGIPHLTAKKTKGALITLVECRIKKAFAVLFEPIG